MEQLREWLNTQCEQRDLSWRDASLRAGVYSGAISAIMNGQRPGLEVCKALASFFGVSPEYVLRLAGHLPPRPNLEAENAELAYTIQQIAEILSRLPPDLQQKLSNQIITQAELAEAAYSAGQRAIPEETEEAGDEAA